MVVEALLFIIAYCYLTIGGFIDEMTISHKENPQQ
jgi:hypothetical protein